MNKQAITFLSLFSLILILSVYYMLLPENEVTVTTSLSAISQLQSDLDKRREQIEIKNQEIISQENSTSESVKLAIEVIAENKEYSQIEEKINEVIKSMGYSEVFSEVNDNIAEITIVKKDANKSDASLVIKTILEEIGNEYQIQVKFIE